MYGRDASVVGCLELLAGPGFKHAARDGVGQLVVAEALQVAFTERGVAKLHGVALELRLVNRDVVRVPRAGKHLGAESALNDTFLVGSNKLGTVVCPTCRDWHWSTSCVEVNHQIGDWRGVDYL